MTNSFIGKGINEEEEGKRAYLNLFGREIWKVRGKLILISVHPPKRLMIQATDSVLQQNTDVTWRRTKAETLT